MKSVTFRLTPSQRRSYLQGVLVWETGIVVTVAVIIAVTSSGDLHASIARVSSLNTLAGLAVVLTWGAVTALREVSGVSVITRRGIETNRWRHRFTPWDNIIDVDVVDVKDTTGSTSQLVRITLRDGKNFTLRAPRNSPDESDPKFTAKVQFIESEWEAALEAQNKKKTAT